MNLFENFMLLFLESAPWLLLGLFIAGQIKQLVPENWIKQQLGKGRQIWKAAFIGAPLPLCSCGVIPTAMALRRAGASKASTASFLVATPETGVDSVSVTYALMGPVMAIARPVSAIFSAVMTGSLVHQVATEDSPSPEQSGHCCCGGAKKIPPTIWQKFVAGLQYGFGRLLGDFVGWLLIGLFVAAAIHTFIPQDWLARFGSGPIGMGLMVIVAIPMYVCATASTPIAAGLMLAGISPGAALVFMLAGPATNIATMAVVKNELGMRSLIAYLVGVIGSALLMGTLLDYLVRNWQLTVHMSTGQHQHFGWLAYLSGIVLAGMIALQYAKRLPASYRPAWVK